MGFMTSLTAYCSIENISNWCTRSPQGPWRDPYYVTWYTHKVTWL